jgi:hypothetical protein
MFDTFGFRAAHECLRLRRMADAKGDKQQARRWHLMSLECEKIGLDMPQISPRAQMERSPFR